VDIASLGTTVRVFIDAAVFINSPGLRFFWILRLPYLPGEDDTGSSFSTNNSNSSRRPGKDKVGTDALIQHAVVCAGEGLSQHD